MLYLIMKEKRVVGHGDLAQLLSWRDNAVTSMHKVCSQRCILWVKQLHTDDERKLNKLTPSEENCLDRCGTKYMQLLEEGRQLARSVRPLTRPSPLSLPASPPPS